MTVLRIAIAAVSLGLFASQAQAAAERVKVLDNERLTITHVTYPPGEHQAALHPPPGTGQVLVVLGPAEVEVSFQEGDKKWTEKGPVPEGKVWYIPPTLLHQFTNIGKTPFVFVSTTFK